MYKLVKAVPNDSSKKACQDLLCWLATEGGNKFKESDGDQFSALYQTILTEAHCMNTRVGNAKPVNEEARFIICMHSYELIRILEVANKNYLFEFNKLSDIQVSRVLGLFERVYSGTMSDILAIDEDTKSVFKTDSAVFRFIELVANL